jgi:hypothetical protein
MARMATARSAEEEAEKKKMEAKVSKEEAERKIFDESQILSFSMPDSEQAAAVAQALDGRKFEGIQIGMQTNQAESLVQIKGVPVTNISYKLYGQALGQPRRFFMQSDVKTSPLGIVWVDEEDSTIRGFFILFTSEHPPTDDELRSAEAVAESKANADNPDQMVAGIPKRWLKPILDAKATKYNMKNWGDLGNQLFKNLGLG